MEAASQLLLAQESQIDQKTVDLGDELLKEELGFTVMSSLWSYDEAGDHPSFEEAEDIKLKLLIQTSSTPTWTGIRV